MGHARQDEVGADFGERLQHEASFGDAGVGECEFGVVELQIATIEQIEIDGARGVAFRAAGPAVLSNVSYFERRAVQWDPVTMTVKG